MKLEGIRVLDLSRFLPGPMLTQAMADHGAEIIKVEAVGEGEPTRSVGEKRDGISVFFANSTRGKRSIAIDLKQPPGRELLMRLAATSDVLVESFRPGVADRLGLGYAAVAARAPAIVYASISAFGQSGPYRDLATHDLAIEAMAGVLSITRGQDGAPAIPGLPAADMLSSLTGLAAVLMALLRRKDTGRGDFIDIAMADCLVASLPNNFGSAMAAREQPDVTRGRSLGGNALYALYQTADGEWIALGGQEKKFADNLMRLLGRGDLIPVCEAPPGPAQEPVREFLRDTFATRTQAEWKEAFRGHDLPFAPVQSLPEVLDDPHFRARHTVVTDERGWDHVTSPIRFAAEPAQERLEIPKCGSSTDDLLTELGYEERERVDLEANGVISLSVLTD